METLSEQGPKFSDACASEIEILFPKQQFIDEQVV